MSRTPAQVRLTSEEEATLRGWTRKGTSEQHLVERAKIILLSHEGVTVENIALRLDTRPARVSKWRQRFAQDRLSALSDAPRSGKPRTYDGGTEARMLALLDQPAPDGYGSGTVRCWPRRWATSAPTRFGAFSAAAAFNSGAAAVGASPPIRSSARRPPTWWLYF